MTFTPKEMSLLKDLRSQEQLCVEKYSKYSNDASDGQLKNLFAQIGQTEQQHLQTLEQIAAGSMPQMAGGQSGSKKSSSASFTPAANYSPQDKQKDTFLCSDMLSTEKHVSSTYNISIFEFSDSTVRDTLNHIQKEEQEHGDSIYKFMSVNGMYC